MKYKSHTHIHTSGSATPPPRKNSGCANGRNGVFSMPDARSKSPTNKKVVPAPEPLDDLNEIHCQLLNISVLQCSAACDLEYDTIDI